jgi:pyruvate,orthophosphate dikinase
MFREEGRPPFVQEMILNAPGARRGEAEARQRYLEALDRLGEFQVGDFYGILQAMDGLPVIIRLIDPPLHEFLPKYDRLLVEVTELRARGASGPELQETEELLEAVEAMHEQNPMLGLRGCRLGIMFPEIVQMQVRAIASAAARLKKEGKNPVPEIMVPLVGTRQEMQIEYDALKQVVEEVFSREGVSMPYMIGTMIEVPRACMVADQLADKAEFFSFGTNDLTQTTYGYSRDDAEGKFLGHYVEAKILPANPFQTIDSEGVGGLMRIAVERGRQARADLELGICGEHGGDPESVAFCHQIGLDYVSCSPGRIPIARLAAAQAALGYTPTER